MLWYSNLNEEEIKYEVPKKMYEASRNLTLKLKELNIDEFGDQIFDWANLEDLKSQDLVNAWRIMKFWISKAIGEKTITLSNIEDKNF